MRKLLNCRLQVKDCDARAVPILCIPMTESNQKTTYEDAGVSIDRGNALVERIKQFAANTHNPGVMESLGGFGALFNLGAFNYKDPVLVSGTDGVGTKIKLAIDMGIHNSIGIDLVAMCANDLVVQGARPLFFLDYFACSKLDVDIASQVIEGISQGCLQAGCALIGGETAEMPGMYASGDYDLAGFCVGAVERDKLINGKNVKPGDVLIGIASSGPHSNGYSLVRKIISDKKVNLSEKLHDIPLGNLLLAPTRIYIKPLLALLDQVEVKTLAHITGGGITENLPRVLPKGLVAKINSGSWVVPPVFSWLQQMGNIETAEMFRTFNCGVGMIVCVSKEQQQATLQSLTQQGETAWLLGSIVEQTNQQARVIFSP